jgi:hypothetical protein
MRTMITGFTSYMTMRNSKNQDIRVIDTALTVVGTLLIAVTWVMLRG